MKSHLPFNTGQRVGIIGLVLIVIALLGITYVVSHKNIKPKKQLAVGIKVQHWIDSVKQVSKAKPHRYKIYPFNPNFITDYKGYVLGMSPEEISRLHRFRKQDKWVNSAADFQRVTHVSDSLLNKIKKYFKFPDWVVRRQKRERRNKQKKTAELTYSQKADLNQAGIEDLIKIKGIGMTLARRIVRHRKQLGGFVDNVQLKDIYGLNYKRRQAVLSHYTVKNTGKVKKLDINTALTEDLTKIYYIDYELARKIINYRITHHRIKSFEELAKIDGFPVNRMAQIKLYLKIVTPTNLEAQ